jgi:nitrite reductase (NO-forming)
VLGCCVLVVALAAGTAACGGDDDEPRYVEPTGPAVADLTFEAQNFEFTPARASAPEGILEITLESTEGAHDLVFDGVPGFILDAPGSGKTDTKKIDLDAGEHEFYCTLPGHRQAGMEGTLTVGGG